MNIYGQAQQLAAANTALEGSLKESSRALGGADRDTHQGGTDTHTPAVPEGGGGELSAAVLLQVERELMCC
jgi:hypothetical protein